MTSAQLINDLVSILEGDMVLLIMWASAILSVFCIFVWLTFEAFKVSLLWGVFSLVPFMNLIFASVHWRSARNPVTTGVVFSIVSAGFFVARFLTSNFYTPAALV